MPICALKAARRGSSAGCERLSGRRSMPAWPPARLLGNPADPAWPSAAACSCSHTPKSCKISKLYNHIKDLPTFRTHGLQLNVLLILLKCPYDMICSWKGFDRCRLVAPDVNHMKAVKEQGSHMCNRPCQALILRADLCKLWAAASVALQQREQRVARRGGGKGNAAWSMPLLLLLQVLLLLLLLLLEAEQGVEAADRGHRSPG